MAELLFVYGTLRKADPSQKQSLLGGSRSLGRGVVSGKLYHLGKYPGAIPGSGRVIGEVYELTDFPGQIPLLDEYEGCDEASPEPQEYRRERVGVQLDTGQIVEAWIYWYAMSTEKLPDIANGDWLSP